MGIENNTNKSDLDVNKTHDKKFSKKTIKTIAVLVVLLCLFLAWFGTSGLRYKSAWRNQEVNSNLWSQHGKSLVSTGVTIITWNLLYDPNKAYICYTDDDNSICSKFEIDQKHPQQLLPDLTTAWIIITENQLDYRDSATDMKSKNVHMEYASKIITESLIFIENHKKSRKEGLTGKNYE